MRRLALACYASGTQVKLRSTHNFGMSDISTNDGLLLFVEVDPTITTDDRWDDFIVGSVTTGTCPDGTAATVVNLPSAAIVPSDIQLDAPVRNYELMTMSIYTSGGRSWLGMSANGSTLQPVLGPSVGGRQYLRLSQCLGRSDDHTLIGARDRSDTARRDGQCHLQVGL